MEEALRSAGYTERQIQEAGFESFYPYQFIAGNIRHYFQPKIDALDAAICSNNVERIFSLVVHILEVEHARLGVRLDFEKDGVYFKYYPVVERDRCVSFLFPSPNPRDIVALITRADAVHLHDRARRRRWAATYTELGVVCLVFHPSDDIVDIKHFFDFSFLLKDFMEDNDG